MYHSHFGCSFISQAGCVHCVGSFPMAVWLGHQMSNGMLLVECETEISSGRNWRDFTKTLGKPDFHTIHTVDLR